MQFKDKYTPVSEKEVNKKIVSDDFYMLGEMIDNLIKQLERNRLT